MTVAPPITDSRPPRRPGPALDDAIALMRANPAVQRNPRTTRTSGDTSAHTTPARTTDLPLVSIVTVVLNREKTLPDALRSVFSQTYAGPIEYIVVDGGSRDGTVEVIRKNAERIAAYVSERDGGISDAFNRGLGLTTGTIIGILNSDDWYEVDTVERVVEEFQRNPGAGLVCGRLQYWNDEQPDAIFPSQPERLGIDMTVNHPTIFVHRELYARAGLFKLNYRYAMDYELVLRFQALGARFASIDRVLANMRFDGAADRNWFRSLREMRVAQREVYPGSVRFAIGYWWKFSRACVARMLAKLGLGALNRIYRSRFSRFRRTYDRAE